MKMQLGDSAYRWRRLARKWMADRQIRQLLMGAGCLAGGFCLSAASLGGYAQPFCLSALCVGTTGWLPLPFAIGSGLGYWVFWGQAGLQSIFWLALGLPICLWLGQKEKTPAVLASGLTGLVVAVSGVIFQLWQGEAAPIGMYLLRTALAFGATWLFGLVQERQTPAADWVAMGIGVLALAQIAPLPFLPLGYVAAGLMALAAPFPAVAMAGLALDLSGVTLVPMTAVLCGAYLARLLPGLPKAGQTAMLPVVYTLVMLLCGRTDFAPLPGLLLGGFLYLLLPVQAQGLKRRGGVDMAQVHLEMTAVALEQAQQLLQEAKPHPLDEQALMMRAAERACGGCTVKNCPASAQARALPKELLHRVALEEEDAPHDCKKKGRLLRSLQLGQEQYRSLKADRDRRQEYRAAVIQQYEFLAAYLREMAEDLPKEQQKRQVRFQPEVAVCSQGKENANGDRCLWFSGTANRYYVLLCDGMGTGEGAAYEAKIAGNMLRRLLIAGYPAQYALRSLNSLCVLRGRAGAVTVDLVETDLRTGQAVLYKWGAASSWLLDKTGPARIGQEGPPPGICMEEVQETVDRFSLQQGAALVLLSDGLDGETAVAALKGDYDQPAGFLASAILDGGKSENPDDATAAVLRLWQIDG